MGLTVRQRCRVDGRVLTAVALRDLAGDRVVVTGATGFVGHYLVRVLLQRGAQVVGAVRDPSKGSALKQVGVELRRADLADAEALARAFTGARAVIHNAGLISLLRHPPGDLLQTNVEGTARVMRAAADQGVERVVMTSTGLVYRPRPGHRYREGDPIRSLGDGLGRLNGYGVTKAEAERVATSIARERRIELCIARPFLVFGAFDHGSFTRYFRLAMTPPVLVWFTHVRLASVYAGDLAEAMVRMLEAPASAGRIYNVAAAPEEITWWGLYRAWKRAGAEWKLAFPIPLPVRRELVASELERDLGWHPRPLADAFDETLALERGELPPHDPVACGPWPPRGVGSWDTGPELGPSQRREDRS